MVQEERTNRGFMSDIWLIFLGFQVLPASPMRPEAKSETHSSTQSFKMPLLRFCVIGVPLLMILGCEQPELATLPVEISGRTMGTHYAVKLGVAPRLNTEILAAELEQILEKLNQVFSTYQTRSELSQLNQHKTAGEHSLSMPLWNLLALAKALHEKSSGAFDVTVSPLVDLWGFGAQKRRSFSEIEQRLEQVLSLTGSELYSLPTPGVLVKHDKELALDLSAIAKGYAVDVIANYLEGRGLQHYLVDIGGEIRTRGTNASGRAWIVGIEKPIANERRVGWQMALGDKAMASSGDYRNHFDYLGARYSHLIDPRNGRPIPTRNLTVTVVSELATIADAWATAMAVLGPEHGLALAEAERLAVQFVVGNKTYRSTAFDLLDVEIYEVGLH